MSDLGAQGRGTKCSYLYNYYKSYNYLLIFLRVCLLIMEPHLYVKETMIGTLCTLVYSALKTVLQKRSLRASQVALMVKNPPAHAGETRNADLISGSENCAPLQYSCLGNPMHRGTWWVTVCEAAKSRTQLNSEHTHTRGDRRKSAHKANKCGANV